MHRRPINRHRLISCLGYLINRSFFDKQELQNEQQKLVSSGGEDMPQLKKVLHRISQENFWPQTDFNSDKNFSFITYIDNLKNVIPFLNDKSKLLIDDSLMLLKSSNIITTLPSVQDSEAKEIESASEFINDDKYSKETIDFKGE